MLGDAEVAQPRDEVVRVQHRGLGRVAQAFGAERADVRVRADEAAVVALEPAQPADRLRVVEAEVERRRIGAVVAGLAVIGAPHDPRHHEVRLHPLGDRDRAAPRAAAAVRLGERLVQVEVHDVEAHVARARDAHDRVEVRAVVVGGRPRVADDLGDLLDVRVEDPERVRVREHEAGDRVVRLRLEVLDVDAPVGVRGDLHDLEAGHRHRRRVRAVRRVGGQDLRAPVVAAVGVVGPRQQHAGELAVGARARLQRHVRQPGDLAQRALQAPHELERALCAGRVLARVQPGVAGQRRDPLVQARVVLHRARAERIEARVEVEVALREPHVVAHELGLAHLGEPRGPGAAQRRSGAAARPRPRARRARGM